MFLYKFKNKLNDFEIANKYDLKIFTPSIFNYKLHKGFPLIYFLWYFFTLGKYKIVYVLDESKIIHYSHVIPKFWKFNFMKKNDLEVGPCWTDKTYRGQGIYPYIINFSEFDDLYMLVDENNISSIRGIEKTGFILVGNVTKNNLFGVYKNE